METEELAYQFEMTVKVWVVGAGRDDAEKQLGSTKNWDDWELDRDSLVLLDTEPA